MRTCLKALFLLLGMSVAGLLLNPPALANSLEVPTAPAEVDTESSDNTELPDNDTESTVESEAPDEAENTSANHGTENNAQPEDKTSTDVDNKEKEEEEPEKLVSTLTKDPTKNKKNRKSHQVKTEHFKVEVHFNGTIVARNTAEIILRPEAWSEFKIEEIVPHGSEVHEGQVLVRFDGQKLQEAIDSLELELRLSDLAIRRAEEELPRLEKMLDLKLSNTQQNAERAREDYERFKKL